MLYKRNSENIVKQLLPIIKTEDSSGHHGKYCMNSTTSDLAYCSTWDCRVGHNLATEQQQQEKQ